MFMRDVIALCLMYKEGDSFKPFMDQIIFFRRFSGHNLW